MKKIIKNYKTLKQAETYQNRLYNKYKTVRLVAVPPPTGRRWLFSEEGQYVWEVQ